MKSRVDQKPVSGEVVHSSFDCGSCYRRRNCLCTQGNDEDMPFSQSKHIPSQVKYLLALPIVFSVYHKPRACIKLGYMFALSLCW